MQQTTVFITINVVDRTPNSGDGKKDSMEHLVNCLDYYLSALTHMMYLSGVADKGLHCAISRHSSHGAGCNYGPSDLLGHGAELMLTGQNR